MLWRWSKERLTWRKNAAFAPLRSHSAIHCKYLHKPAICISAPPLTPPPLICAIKRSPQECVALCVTLLRPGRALCAVRCGSTQMHPSCHGSASGWRLGPPGGSFHQSRSSGLWRAPASRGVGGLQARTHTLELDPSLHGLKSGGGKVKTLHVRIRGAKPKCGDGRGGPHFILFPVLCHTFLPTSRPLSPLQTATFWRPCSLPRPLTYPRASAAMFALILFSGSPLLLQCLLMLPFYQLLLF